MVQKKFERYAIGILSYYAETGKFLVFEDKQELRDIAQLWVTANENWFDVNMDSLYAVITPAGTVLFAEVARESEKALSGSTSNVMFMKFRTIPTMRFWLRENSQGGKCYMYEW